MKKLLLVLMVVSMAALLLTGCLPKTNTAPVITSTPVLTGTIGTAYTYTVTATDADGDAMTYAVSAPTATGSAFNATTHVFSWTPAAAGIYAVVVTVSDPTESTTQPFNITVPSIGPAEITISVAGEYYVAATDKTYVKGGSNEITVTFPAAVDTPVVKVGTVEVGVFSVDDKVWKGTGLFTDDCETVKITVSGGCEPLCAAKPVVVDSGHPYAELKASVDLCECETGVALTITSDWTEEANCPPDEIGCCGDDCSGLKSWYVEIYDEYPWEECCTEDPCIEPDAVLGDENCPISITKECIAAVYTPEGWVDFYDHTFYVIATLIDNVGNETKYYGEVITDPVNDELVSFVELVFDSSTTECICYAEDPDAADLVIGDCDGTPATECYVEPIPELLCPTVVLDPEIPKVGEVTAITLTFNRAPLAGEDVRAFVGPAIKTLPLGIPEDAAALVITQDATNGAVFTATYTFGTAGQDYIYVTIGCEEDCTPCVTAVTVDPISECPEISWLVPGQAYYTFKDGVIWFKGGETYTLVLTFDHVITSDEQKTFEVRIRDYFDVNDIEDLIVGNIFFESWVLDEFTASAGNTVFMHDFTPPTYTTSGNSVTGEYCTEAYVEVGVLEPNCCAPCKYKFGVDATLPVAEILITAVNSCGNAFLEFDSLPIPCDLTCCGDTCTSLESWTIDIYDTEPVWDCCNIITTPKCSHTGEDCPIDVECVGCAADCCFDTGDYWIVTTLRDAVDNVNQYFVKLTLGGTGGSTNCVVGNWTLNPMYEYDWICDPTNKDDNPFDESPVHTINAAPFVYGDICPIHS
jgi:hypothetical protein